MSEDTIFTKKMLGDTTVIALKGPLDLEKGAHLREVFWECIQKEGATKLIVDLAMVPELDPSTISLLVSTKNVVAKKRGRFTLSGITKQGLALLEQTHLTHYFDISPTLDEALSTQNAGPLNGDRSAVL